MTVDALLYKDLSDAYERVPLMCDVAIRDSLPTIDFSRVVIIANGRSVENGYIVKDGDVIIMRSVPGGVTAAIITAVIVVGVAVGVGVYTYKQRVQMERQMEALKNQMKDSVSNLPYIKGANNSVATGRTQPYIIGEHLFTPYILNSGGSGNYRGYSRISGSLGGTQEYLVTLGCGFGKQVLRKLYCDDVQLKEWAAALTAPQSGPCSFDSTSPFYTGGVLFVRQGEQLPGRYGSFGIISNEDSFNKYFNTKIVEQQVNKELKKADDNKYEHLVFTCERYTSAVKICILFNGLLQYNDEGDKQTRSVTVIPEYSLNNGESWTEFYFTQGTSGSNTFAYNTLNQMRFCADISFNKTTVYNAESAPLVRVRCTTNKYDGSAYDGVTVLFVQSTVFNPDKSGFPTEPVIADKEKALSTLLGIRIVSTSSNEDKLSKINCITSGVARTWDGATWSATKVPTRNPASWLLEVLTSDTHEPSKIDDDDIDLDSFGEAYEYCEAEHLTIDLVLTDGATKKSVLQKILTVFYSVLYRDIYGKLSIATDKQKENAVAVLNAQNLVSFSYTKSIARRTDGIKVTYISRAAEYVKDTVLVHRVGADENAADNIYREMNLDGVTEYEQVVKHARRMMAIDELRPKTVTAKIGKEGYYFTPYSKVIVQHASLKIGLGNAEIRAVVYSGDGTQIIGVTLYEPIEYDSTDANGYGVIMQCVGADYCTPINAAYTAPTNGRASEIVFISPISANASAIPHSGDILSYGYLDAGSFNTIASPFLITGIQPDDTGFTLTLVDYNESIYDAGEIPAYTPNITQPKSIPSDKVPGTIPPATLDDVNNLAFSLASGTFNVSAPDVPTSIVAVPGRDAIALSCSVTDGGLANSLSKIVWQVKKSGSAPWDEAVEITAKTNEALYSFLRSGAGAEYLEASALAGWSVRAKAVNQYQKESAWSDAVSLTLTNYGTWIPAAPTAPKITADRDFLTLSWSYTAPTLYYGSVLFVPTLSYNGVVRSGVPESFTRESTYTFNRAVDGYPEKTVIDGVPYLGNYSLSVAAINGESGVETEMSPVATVLDVSTYKTWIPTVPTVAVRCSNRTVTLGFASQSLYVYGDIAFDVQIGKCKITDGEDTAVTDWPQNWHTPATDDNNIRNVSEAFSNILENGTEAQNGYVYHYGDFLSAYADTSATEPLRVTGSSFSQSLPLDQVAVISTDFNSTGEQVTRRSSYALDTEYRLRVRAVNLVAGHVSGYSGADALGTMVQATTTSAVDVVNNSISTAQIVNDSITANKLFVSALAAISANMGQITDGALTGNENNYWILTNGEYADGNGGTVTRYAGDFRVGGSNGTDYIQCSRDPDDSSKYTIAFHASSFEITALGTLVRGGFFVAAQNTAVNENDNPISYYFKVDKDSGNVHIKEALTIDGNASVGGALTAASVTASGNVSAATFNGLSINTSGTNNVANQIVRTNGRGYAYFGWIYTISGAASSPTRFYCSQDGSIRYLGAAAFRNALGLGNTTGVLPVANGGTGQTVAANATAGRIPVGKPATVVNGSIWITG